MRLMLLITVCILVAALGAATKAAGQVPYSLDTSYRTELVSENVNSIVLLASGKILASGQMKYPGDPIGSGSFRGSTRLMPDGSRDIGFTAFTGAGKLVPWSNKIYVSVGSVKRLDANGIVDPSFLVQNMGLDPYMQSSSGEDYHVYPNGSLMVSGGYVINDTVRGNVGSYDLAWLSNTGYYDTTRTPRRCEPGRTILRLQVLPNGQFICTSNCTMFEGKAVDWIFRFNADGTPDTTFRTDVYVGSAFTFLPLTDGRVYTGGIFRRSVAPQDTLRLVRFMPDGSLDPTFAMPQFNDGGLNGPYIGPGVSVIEPWFNHTLLVAGQFSFVNGEPRNSICVIDSTGQLTSDFDACGVGPFQSSFLNYTHQDIADVLLDSANNYLYICGAYSGYSDVTINDPTQRFVSRLFLGSIATGVEATPAAPPPSFTLQPNPASTWCAVSFQGLTEEAIAEVYLEDASGRLVQRIRARGAQGQVVLDTQALAPGVYTVRMTENRVPLSAQRLVVQP